MKKTKKNKSKVPSQKKASVDTKYTPREVALSERIFSSIFLAITFRDALAEVINVGIREGRLSASLVDPRVAALRMQLDNCDNFIAMFLRPSAEELTAVRNLRKKEDFDKVVEKIKSEVLPPLIETPQKGSLIITK